MLCHHVPPTPRPRSRTVIRSNPAFRSLTAAAIPPKPAPTIAIDGRPSGLARTTGVIYPPSSSAEASGPARRHWRAAGTMTCICSTGRAYGQEGRRRDRHPVITAGHLINGSVDAPRQHPCTCSSAIHWRRVAETRGVDSYARYSRSNPLLMMVFWISLVPSPMSRNGASRISRSISYSLE